MELELPPDMDRAQVSELVREAMADVDVAQGSVSAVIVADDFRAAVARVLGHQDKVTEGIDFGGKAIPKPTEDGVHTTVLLPAAPFRQLLDELAGQRDVCRLSGESRMFRYAIRHEFGHAKDYRIRGITGHEALDRSSPFRLVEVERRYLEELLQEFIACAHSGRSVTQEEFRLIWENECKITQHFRRGLHGNLRCFLSGGYEGGNPQRTFKYEVAGFYWLILVSHAKVFGFRGVNPELELPGPIRDRLTREVDAIFTDLYEVLKRQWACYPNFDEGLNREIITLWHRLMRVEGFTFETRDQEDMLKVEIRRDVVQDLPELRLPPTITV
jgi:hypothetical protein